MAKARRHPSALRIFTLACAGGGDDEHVKECPDCAARAEALGRIVAGVRREAAFHAAAEPAPVRAPLPFRTKDLLASARRAEDQARHLVLAAEEGDDELAQAVEEARASGADLTQTLVYACQNAAKLAGTRPERAMALAAAVGREAAGAGPGGDRLRLESALLDSQALLFLLRSNEALVAAQEIRSILPVHGGDALFDGARVDYFEGSAASFAGAHELAFERLGSALDAFVRARVDRWIGRAEAAIGLAILLQRGDDPAALEHFAAAEERLVEDEDHRTVTGIINNQGSVLLHLGRYGEAREKFSQVLKRSLQARYEFLAVDARLNLAELHLLEGRPGEAKTAFEKIVPTLESRNFTERLVKCRLHLVECSLRLGLGEEVKRHLEAVRAYRGPGTEAAIDDLFSFFDAGDLDMAIVRHVRAYVEAVADGETTPYRLFRRA